MSRESRFPVPNLGLGNRNHREKYGSEPVPEPMNAVRLRELTSVLTRAVPARFPRNRFSEPRWPTVVQPVQVASNSPGGSKAHARRSGGELIKPSGFLRHDEIHAPD
jgi:hypothetical protein